MFAEEGNSYACGCYAYGIGDHFASRTALQRIGLARHPWFSLPSVIRIWQQHPCEVHLGARQVPTDRSYLLFT